MARASTKVREERTAGETFPMQRRRYEFVLEAEQAIAHHEGTFGNTSLAMRRRIRYGDEWVGVPCVSADAMRHGMREAAAHALLDAAGLTERPSLSEAALRLLFAGGMVTGRGDAGTINLDRYRELCELIPSMAIFGGCSDNRVIPGQLAVEDATLICIESERFVPAWAVAEARSVAGLDVARQHLEEVQRVRMDPTLRPEKLRLLTEDERVRVNARLLKSETSSADDDSDRSGKSSMMPRTFERVAQGSMFSWACEARLYSPLEEDTFHVAVGCFMAHAIVGGKSGTGHGKLRPVAARRIERSVDLSLFGESWTAPPALPSSEVAIAEAGEEIAIRPRDLTPGELFREHVAARADRIVDLLQKVNA